MARRRRKKQKTRNYTRYLLTLLLACALYFGYEPLANVIQSAPATTEALPADANALLPAPLKGTPEKILVRRGYTVSYNLEHNLPNWVAWELTPDKLIERESRTDKFLPDPDLPEDVAVTTDDYKRSGWDRGHMCPAGDNRWHWRAMQESFYMTNICPQHHNLNRGDWKELEEACRKVVLCPDSNPPRAIGFLYKNTSGNHPLDSYVNSVDQMERITGIDFFPALPDEVEEKVEAEYDLGLWKMP